MDYTLCLGTIPWAWGLYLGPGDYTLGLGTIPWALGLYPVSGDYTFGLGTIPWPYLWPWWCQDRNSCHNTKRSLCSYEQLLQVITYGTVNPSNFSWQFILSLSFPPPLTYIYHLYLHLLTYTTCSHMPPACVIFSQSAHQVQYLPIRQNLFKDE